MLFRTSLVVSALLLAACASERETRPATCNAESGALVDLAAMRDAINQSMAYPTGGGVKADSIFESLKAQATAARTPDEHLKVMEDFVYELGDHHTHIGTNNKQSRRLVPTSASVWAESRGGEIVITEVRPGSKARGAGLREGMVVESINGVGIGQALKPPLATPELSEAMIGFAARVALAGTHEKDAVVRAGDAKGAVEASLVAPEETQQELASLSYPKAGVALIRLNNSIGNSDLPRQFDALMRQANGAGTLILDLRDTPSGGNSDVAKPIMAWFTQGRRGYQKHQRGERSWIEQVQGRGDGFRGRLIVLVDHWTGSMGEGTAIGLRSAAGATLVGTRMAGLRGAIEGFDLPCLGASVRLPVERLFSVDGQPREFAAPEVVVGEVELSAAGADDAILRRALALLR